LVQPGTHEELYSFSISRHNSLRSLLSLEKTQALSETLSAQGLQTEQGNALTSF
jgi:hypothetical protein